MFLYLYVDVFANYIPGRLEDLIAGEIAGFQITQVALLGFMILMTIPGLMVFLSLALKAKASRWTNIIVGIGLFIIGIILNLSIGFLSIASLLIEAVMYVVTILVVWYAWKWQKD